MTMEISVVSAILSFAYADRVHILTDGAFTDASGTLVGTACKVEILPRHKIAITGRALLAEKIYGVIAKFVHLSANEAADFTTDDMLEVIEAGFATLADQGEFPGEFFIGAWSEAHGPLHFFVPCHGACGKRARPFDMFNPGAGTQMSAGPELDLKGMGISLDELQSADFPEIFGAEIIGAMRASGSIAMGASSPSFNVGGRADLTTVSAGGVTSTLLKTWDEDVPGGKIQPSGRTH